MLRICYILDRPELGGGVKVVFQHAQLLQQQGHCVHVLGIGPKPDWVEFDGVYLNRADTPVQLPSQDLLITTYWTTIEYAESLALGPIVHFCQGFEGGLPHLAKQHADIEAVYRRDYPCFVVAPHLADLMRNRFNRPAFLVSPPLDPAFQPRVRLLPAARPWIAIHGIFECDSKGVACGLKAVALLRRRGVNCRVLRVSLLEQSPAERALLAADCFLHAVAPTRVAEAMRGCDLLFFPATAAEGFGLPLLEAMISKVPVVSSATPSTPHVTSGSVRLVAPGDPQAFADVAEHLLRNPIAWQTARRRAYAAANRFRASNVSKQLEEGLQWALREVRSTPGISAVV